MAVAAQKRSPKRATAAPFTLPHFRAWAAALTLDDDERWELEPWQEAFAEDLFAGFPVNWLIVPEGNGKTTLVAGLALYHIEFTSTGYVPVAASSREQAEWIYRQAEGFVFRAGRRNREGTKDLFKCLEGYRRIRCDDMGSRIQVFAADDRSGDGIIPTLAILDELHRHRDLALYRTWAGKLRKRGGQLVVISTAGEVGGEFEATRTLIRQDATEVTRDGSFLRAEKTLEGRRLGVLHEWAMPEDGDPDDLEQVKAANPFSGVTVESLAEKRGTPGMIPAHWLRFTCNRPSRTVEAAVTETEWFSAVEPDGIPAGERVWLGLDLGWKYDTTAVVPLWWRDPEFRLFGRTTILTPPRDGKSMDPRLVEQALTDFAELYALEGVVMDMTAGEQLASWIEAQFGCEVVDYSQKPAAQVVDYLRFMEALREGWLRHSGDPGLTRHVLNASVRMLPGGDVVFARPHQSRLGSKWVSEQREIDGLVAAAMVHSMLTARFGEPAPEEVLVAWG